MQNVIDKIELTFAALDGFLGWFFGDLDGPLRTHHLCGDGLLYRDFSSRREEGAFQCGGL